MKRLLIVGYGDIARRAARALESRFAIFKVSRASGVDLDRPQTLELPAAEALLHCAPPPATGETDPRTANLLAALKQSPARLVYISTSGVYGDCRGELVDETRPLNPQTPRARRRADAEARLGFWCKERGIAFIVLRVPGIYASDRLPLERLRAGLPVLRAADDVYTNHIHADDLAAAVVRALDEDAPAGTYNASDDSELRMAEWMDFVADYAGLPRPPRLPRSRVAQFVSPEALSFMSESRRLDNRRLKSVLGFQLRYPNVYQGLRHEHVIGVD